MSRSRWFVLLGPPLLAVAAGSSVLASVSPGAVPGTSPTPRPPAACGAAPSTPGNTLGTWWHQDPIIDAAGALKGWTLQVGTAGGAIVGGTAGADHVPAGPVAQPTLISLPPASLVSGPDRGRVIVSVDDGRRSTVRIVDAASGCARSLDFGPAVARRAVADPAGSGVLVHLLDRNTRADLGIWRVTADGQPMTRVLAPLDADAQARAGIGRVWTTALRASADGMRLAVQSCDPNACLTRVLDLQTGGLSILSGEQGDIVGFAGERIITMAACHGLPCGVLSWATDGSRPAALEPAALAAAVSPDGRVVVVVADGSGRTHARVSDAAGGNRRSLGPLAAEALIASGGSATSGIEAGPDAVGILAPTGVPAVLALDSATSPVTPAPEVQP